jgi:predicted transcriptional regulator
VNLEYSGLGSTVDILTILLKEGEMNRGAFVKITNYDSAMKILSRLESAGMTECEERGDRRNTVIWRLTDKGKRVAEMLMEVERVIISDYETP